MDTMANQTPAFDSNFPVDMAIRRNLDFATSNAIWSRLTGEKYMNTDSTAAESNDSESFDHMDGWGDGSTYSGNQAWMWKRAPGYFDVCCYSGTGSARTISHNLGVAPEMMWVKKRSSGDDWFVYVGSLGNTNKLELNSTSASGSAAVGGNQLWNSTTPTSSVFSVSDNVRVNESGQTYIAYLFATVAGISKCGSFTLGSSGSTNIDCGFSSGARFILAKKTSGTGGWLVWDTVRGIVAGNDPYILLNSTAAETGGYDFVDPYSQGFTIPEAAYWGAGDYIFYAIA
jgi:hypothetical protein